MPRIQILPETLANQIAAGEVVERPAAAVKELVENALDAGARRIDVELLEGGRRLVRVRDDGCGMSREDAELSLQRHATSKLRSKDDLFDIHSYGFRGEALPSLAAVSRFALLTAEPDALAGTRVEIEGGRLVHIGDAGAPQGTTVEVRDLFWNVPARRKFLKRAQAELASCIDAVLRLAVPRLDAAFTVREGERVMLRVEAGATIEERAEEALGREVRGQLLPFEHAVRGVRAHGVAVSPAIDYGNARNVWLFVNGRAIRDRSLTHAVLRAYGELLPHGRYPGALIFLEVPPAEVDVNVHPAKAEVRLADARAAWEAIHRALTQILASGRWLHAGHAHEAPWPAGEAGGDVSTPGGDGRVPENEPFPAPRLQPWSAPPDRQPWGAQPANGEASVEARPQAGEDELPANGDDARSKEEAGRARVAEALARYAAHMPAEEYTHGGARLPSLNAGGLDRARQIERRPDGGRTPDGAQARSESMPAGQLAARGPAQRELVPQAAYFEGLRYLGQLHRSYLVCEGPRGLVLVDQHAAHERMNYQRLRGRQREPVQPLLVPIVVELPAAAAARMGEAEGLLREIGVEVESFGARSAVVKTLPRALSSLDESGLAALLVDLADELDAHGRGESLERRRDALLARAACHASVRARDALSPGEAQALLNALDGTDYGARCAHGRPVVAEWGTVEIEKRFGRDYGTHAHAAAPESL